MASKRISFSDWLQSGLVRVCRIHFVAIAVYTLYIIAADATRLITPDSVLRRWTANATMLAGIAIIWYLARSNVKNSNYYRVLLYGVILLDIMMATFNVYTQRGMAARAVMLYAVPIAVSAILLSRTALYMTAALCAAAYSLAAVKYFVDFFNEGFKAELYIEVGFYCAVFFGLAAILSIVVKFKDSGSP